MLTVWEMGPFKKKKKDVCGHHLASHQLGTIVDYKNHFHFAHAYFRKATLMEQSRSQSAKTENDAHQEWQMKTKLCLWL